MRDRHLVPHQPSLMLSKGDAGGMTPLTRAPPDCLKFYAVHIQDHLRAALALAETIQNHLQTVLALWEGQVEPSQAESALTWEIFQELINYNCHVGISRGDQKKKATFRRTEAENDQLTLPGENSGSGTTRNQLLKTVLGKGIPGELMNVLPLPNLQLLVKMWKGLDKNSER